MINNFRPLKKGELAGKNALVVGLQKSGLESALFLLTNGANVTVTDLKSEADLKDRLETLKKSGNGRLKLEIGRHELETFGKQDLIILSPGVPADSEYIKFAANRGIPIVSEIEFASWFAASPYLAITGTNGKTTTTTLCHEILKNSGLFENAYLGGNIGIPFISFAGKTTARDITVLEISSFQMEFINSFSPAAAALLNVTEDHLNRHHTLDNYIDMKMRVFLNQRPENLCVLNADDPIVIKLRGRINSRVRTFTARDDETCDVFVKSGELCVRTDEGCVIKVINKNEIGIIGPHNLSNAAAAVALTYFSFGVQPEKICRTLKEFKGVHHRLEFVAKINGVSFYNDSKATNEDSTSVALKSFKTPVLLIAGGSDKGSDYSTLARDIKKSSVKKVYIIGQVRDIIKNALKKEGIENFTVLNSLEECVHSAYGDAVAGDTVLLSPACASLDMFKNYEHRGEIFISQVNKIRSGRFEN